VAREGKAEQVQESSMSLARPHDCGPRRPSPEIIDKFQKGGWYGAALNQTSKLQRTKSPPDLAGKRVENGCKKGTNRAEAYYKINPWPSQIENKGAGLRRPHSKGQSGGGGVGHG